MALGGPRWPREAAGGPAQAQLKPLPVDVEPQFAVMDCHKMRSSSLSGLKGESKPNNQMSAEKPSAKEELMAVLDAVEMKVEEAEKDCVEKEETDEMSELAQ